MDIDFTGLPLGIAMGEKQVANAEYTAVSNRVRRGDAGPDTYKSGRVAKNSHEVSET